jgi:glycosyltransferase
MRVAHPGTFVKKELYEKFGHFSEGFKIAADHEFLLRVWDECIVEFHNETIVNMRIGGASTSQVKVSYRESMAAAILHGENPICATGRFYLELLKSIFYRL